MGDTSQLFPVLWWLWILYASRAEYKAAQELAEQVMRLAEDSADQTLLMEACYAVGWPLFAFGELIAARER